MQFTVYQIQISRSVSDQINQLGHEGAATKFPEYRAKLDTMFGSEGYKTEYKQFYAPVCEIEAADLDDVFDIGNMGPEEHIKKLAPMHSINVGDIIEDETGAQYMVDSFGFKQIN
jgi:hypothetical protein